MAIIDILLPKMGESVAEATITKLVAGSGDSVEADDPIVEIATDKVDSEGPHLKMVCWWSGVSRRETWCKWAA